MRVLFAILLNVFIINGVFCQKNVKIKINNNSLEINDSCIYLKKEVYQSTFKGLKKIIDNENYFKIKVNKNHINYIFRNEGLGFEYMNRNFIGPPLISIYFSQDTAWSNLFYKKKYLDIGKYHGKLTILDYNISEITTYFELKNQDRFKKYFEEADIDKRTGIKICGEGITTYIYFESNLFNAKIRRVDVEYFFFYPTPTNIKR